LGESFLIPTSGFLDSDPVLPVDLVGAETGGRGGGSQVRFVYDIVDVQVGPSFHFVERWSVSDLSGGDRAMTERVKGRIKWFSHQKRYGFIRRDDGLRDVFVHMNDFRSTADAYWVRDGDAVEFGVEQAPKGPRAVDVVVLSNCQR
jgi:CspA family cold shock protein